MLFEPLEDRRVLSVFYDMNVIAQTSDSIDGATVTDIEDKASVNSRGQVAVVGELDGTNSAVLVGNGNGSATNVAFGTTAVFSTPEINSDRQVAVRAEIASTPHVYTFDIEGTGTPASTVASHGDSVSGGTLTDMSSPMLNEDGEVAFVGESSGASLPSYYYGIPGVGSDEVSEQFDGTTLPQSAQNRTLVYRDVVFGADEIVVATDLGGGYTFETIASTSSGWNSLGAAPGISSDGSVVVFTGDRGDGTGVFAAVDEGSGFGSAFRVAGEKTVDYNPYDSKPAIDNNELGYDASAKGIYLTLSSAQADTRVGVARQNPGGGFDGESFVVTFLAEPSSASIDNPEVAGVPLLFSVEEGIWSVRVDLQKELLSPEGRVYHPTSPIPVLQIDDTYSGDTIASLELHDPIASAQYDPEGAARTTQPGDHYLTFTATTDGGDQLAIRADHLDTDGDGLLDHWEEDGIDIDQDGTIDLDLSAMDADPLHQDVFLEIDWLKENSGRHYEPFPTVTESLVTMFDQAPVSNPDGSTGIVLHIDAGSGTDAVGKAFSQNMGAGSLQGGDEIGVAGDASANLEIVHLGTATTVTGVDARELADVKDNFFGTTDSRARELVFHYAVLSEYSGFYPNNTSPITGTVFSTSGTTLTASGTPFSGYTTDKLKGHIIWINDGTGAGQSRKIVSWSSDHEIVVDSAWTTALDTDSDFVLIGGWAGMAEVDFYGVPDNNGIPGNDFLMSLGGFGATSIGAADGSSYDLLGTGYTQWRTLAHELGHNLGLRHCGTDTEAGTCKTSPFDYLSLMSYAHVAAKTFTGMVDEASNLSLTEAKLYDSTAPFGSTDYTGYSVKITEGVGIGQVLTVTSNTSDTLTLDGNWSTAPTPTAPSTTPVSVYYLWTGVDSYSQTDDPTYDDWSNIRPDFQNTLAFIGATPSDALGAGAGDVQELTVADYEELTGSEPDHTVPTIDIINGPSKEDEQGDSLADDQTIAKGRDLTVYLDVSDDTGIDQVYVWMDADGDGTVDDDEFDTASWDSESEVYRGTIADITGPVGEREVAAMALDTSGNFALDSVDVDVTHDYSFLAEMFVQIGGAFQQSVPEIPENLSIPFVEDTLSDVIDFPTTFQWLTNSFYDELVVTADAAADIADDNETTLIISIDGADPTVLDFVAEADDISELVSNLNGVLADEELDADLEFAVDDDDLLTLRPKDETARSMQVTTLLLEADSAPTGAYGQLVDDLKFDLTVTRGDDNNADTPEESEYLDVTVTIDDTSDNVMDSDLVDDLNDALTTAGADGVVAVLDEDTDIIRLVATDVAIEALDLENGTSGDLGELGFSVTFSATASTNSLGFDRSQEIAELSFSLLEDAEDSKDFEAKLGELLDEYNGTEGFVVNLDYDSDEDILTFDFALDKTYEYTAELNSVDVGIEFGGLIPLEVAAVGEADFTVGVELDFGVGVFLGDLDGEVSIDGSTLLSELNGGDGVEVLVGMTADNAAPDDGQLGADVTMQITIGREDSGDDSVHTLRLYDAPSATDTSRPAGNDNYDVASLQSDLNVLLDQSGLGEILEADTYTYEDTAGEVQRYLMLHAIQTPDSGLSPIRALSISGGEPLGFGTGQEGNFIDLTVHVDADAYDIDLDGAADVQDVINIIDSQTGGAVSLEVNYDGSGLSLSADGVITVESGFVYTAYSANGDDTDDATLASLAASGLGLLASEAYETVDGTSLHGLSVMDRVFIQENTDGDLGFSFTANVEADLDAGAALGCMGLYLTTSDLAVEVAAAASLVDPGVGDDNDQRIYLSEILDDPTAVVDMDNADLTASASGTLTLSTASTDLDGEGDDTDMLEDVSGETDPTVSLTVAASSTDGFTFEPEADFDGILSQFQHACPVDLLSVFSTVIDGIQEADSGVLNTTIPVLDQSLGDLVQFGDGLADALAGLVSDIDLDAVDLALGELDTAISNLSLTMEERDRLFRIGDLLRGLTSEPEPLSEEDQETHGYEDDYADRLADFEDRLSGRLLGGLIQLRQIINEDVDEGTGGRDDLESAYADLAALLPSWNTFANRLQDELNAALDDLGLDDITVDLGFADYDGQSNAMVVGVTLEKSLEDSFEPELPTTDEFGPIAFDGEMSLDLAAGGVLSVGFGIVLDGDVDGDGDGEPDGGVTPVVIVDDSGGLVHTELTVTAGFDAEPSGEVSLGGLDLVEANAYLRLANALHEAHTVADDHTVDLNEVPRNEDPHFVIVVADGLLVDTADVVVDENQLTLSTIDPETEVSVEYQTASLPGDPPDIVNEADDRAQLTIDFAPEAAIEDNAIGAVALEDLFGNTNVEATGMVTSSLGVSFLGSSMDDAVTLAVGLNHLDDPRLEVDADALSSMFTSLDFDLTTILQALETLLGLLEDGLTSEVMTRIPGIGDDFEAAGTFIGDVQDVVVEFEDVLDNLSGDIQTAEDAVRYFLFDQLHNELGILADRDFPLNGITEDDVHVDLTEEHFEILFTLGDSESMGLDFDLGLDGLPISAEGQGGLEFGWTYTADIGVGVDREQGVYLLADAANPEFKFDITAGLAVDSSGGDYVPTAFSLDLFGLELSATDNVDQTTGDPGTAIGAEISLDVIPTDGDKLPMGDLDDVDFGDLFELTLDAEASVDLILEAGLNSNLPSLQTELDAGFEAWATLTGGEWESGFTWDRLQLKNTGINLGDFFSQHVGALITRLTEYLEPIEPVIELLQTEVPGVSDLSEAAGKGPVTMLDIALAKNPDAAATAKQFVDALDTILQIADSLETMDDDSVIFQLMDTLALPTENIDDGSWADGVEIGTAVDDSGGQDHTADESTGTIKSLLQQVEELGIHLHFLEIENIVAMLLGQQFDVISYELPRFELPFEISQKFRVWTVPPISIEVGLNASIFADLSVGYDSHGLLTGNFFDGFYFGDREVVFVGDDIDEFGLGVGVSLAALLDVVAASVGVEGEIRADVLANWRDTDDDGKLHLDEISSIVNTDGIGCLFDLTGEVSALVSLVWEVLGVEGEHTFVDVVLFSFENACPTFELGHVDDGGTLVLHVGPDADQRGPGSSSDTAESLTLTKLDDGVVKVEGLGLESRYAGVTSIYFDGGDYNDSLYVDGIDVPITAYGGDGDDHLYGGSAVNTFYGESGDDELYGGLNDDTLDGGSGDDYIYGDDGGDTIEGGSGDDYIEAGDGADGDDVGEDTVNAGSGNDLVYGRAGIDTLNGDSGVDYIYGGGDGDKIDGGANDDFLFGESGSDEVSGGSGADLIIGGSGGDNLYGDSGNDFIAGGQIDANDDQTTMIEDSFEIDIAVDLDLESDSGDSDDTIFGGIDNDMIIGDDGSDHLYGGWGNDVIIAHLLLERDESDPEYIEGGADDDFICGASADDEIYGGTHSDEGKDDYFAEEGGTTYGGATAISCDAVPTFELAEHGHAEGIVFLDANANAAMDAGESGLESWTVTLYDSSDAVADQQVTDADGNYSFTGIAYGTYTVSVALEDGYELTTPAAGEHSITVAAGGSVDGVDFGADFLGSAIVGRKFHDTDADGNWSLGSEDALNGWQIQLMNEDGNVVAETVTADYDIDGDETISPVWESGWYLFEDLTPGTYYVSEVPRSDWIQSAPELSESDTFQWITDDGFTQTRSDAKVTGLPGVITNVTVTVDIEHDTLEQLEIFLLSPSGTQVTLVDAVGGDGANFTTTVFDDSASTAIDDESAAAPYTGSYQPQGDLSDLNGEFANGVWTLVIQDDQRDVVGRLNEWSLTIMTDVVTYALIDGGTPSPFTPDRLIVSEVTVETGDTAQVYFGNYHTDSVQGRKFEDRDGDGLRGPSEPGLAGVTIYADLNGNAQLDRGEPYTVTLQDDPKTPSDDETGLYKLENLPPGSYTIYEVPWPRSVQTYPASTGSSGYRVTISSGGQEYDNLDFGNMPLGEITGTKWVDHDGDGYRDADEPGLAGVRIYIDANQNSSYDPGEPYAITEHDDPSTENMDETGLYTIHHVAVGDHDIREIVPRGYVQTAAGMQVLYKTGFDGAEAGSEWSVQSLAETPRLNDAYLGELGNETATLHLAGLPAHSELVVEFDLYVVGSWEGNGYAPSESADRWSVTVDGTPRFETTFSNVEGYEQAYPDQWGEGINDAGTEAAGVGKLGYGQTDSVYHVRRTFSHSLSSLQLDFSAMGLDVLGDDVESWGIDNVTIGIPLDYHKVTVEPYQVVKDVDFGNYPPDGGVTGWKWLDSNGNQRRDDDEPGLAGVTIYADENNNGQLDDNEPATVTVADDPKTDVNETGFYLLRGIAPGTVVIREVVPEGFEQTTAGVEPVYTNDFKQTVGDEWTSNDTTSSPRGNRTMLGLFENETVSLSLDDLPSHDVLLVSYDLIIAGSWNGDHAGQGPDKWSFGLQGNEPVLDTTFSNTDNSIPTNQNPVDGRDVDGNGTISSLDVLLLISKLNADGSGQLDLPGSTQGQSRYFDVSGDNVLSPLDVLNVVSRLNETGENQNTGAGISTGSGTGDFFPQAYPDNHGEGQHPPRTGASYVDSMGYDGFGLAADHASYRSNDAVYHMFFAIPHTGSEALLDFTSEGLTNNHLDFEKWGLDNVVVSVPSNGHEIEVQPGQVVPGIIFGNQPTDPDDPGDPNDPPADKYDFGDAPDGPYPTRQANNGARHEVDPDVFLGSQVDTDRDGQPSGDALGDDKDETDDDDGIRFLTRPIAGQQVTLKAKASTAGYLNGWADFNGDGDWQDEGEHFIVDASLTTGDNHITSTVPDYELPPEYLFTRFRFSTHAGLAYAGAAQDGEVEDYRILMNDDSQAQGEAEDDQQSGPVPSTPADQAQAEGEGNDNTVTGWKWLDSNGDGQWQASEPGMKGVTIYADLDGNGQLDAGEPSDVTNDDDPLTTENELGSYELTGLPDGDVLIREIVPANMVFTHPLTGYHTIVFEVVDQAADVNFGNHQIDQGRGIATGTKWNDATEDLGVWDGQDEGKSGVTIYVDLNGNEQLDANEPYDATAEDDPSTAQDETGQYCIKDIPYGTYQVLEVLENGWKRSYPATPYVITFAGNTVNNLDFGNYEIMEIQDGDDVIYAGEGGDEVHGDNVLTDPRNVSVGTRSDTIYGEAGEDELYGQERDDQLSGGEQEDTLDGGEDTDRVLNTSSGDQTLVDTTPPNQAELTDATATDTLFDVEHATLTGDSDTNNIDASGFTYGSVILIGEGGDDVLVGTDLDDELEGGSGDDTLDGKGGDDTLNGGTGSDALQGGADDDVYWFEAATAGENDTITESTDPGIDLLDFSSLSASEPLYVDMFDTLTGWITNSTHHTLVFNNPEYLENIAGGDGDDEIWGSDAANAIWGGGGTDHLYGMGDDDTLYGGADRDYLYGGDDDDEFVVEADWGVDEELYDSAGDDRLVLTNLTVDLTVSVTTDPAVGLTVTDGTNSLFHPDNAIKYIDGGAGDDTYAFEEGTLLANGDGVITDSAGTDLLDYSAYTTDVEVDLSVSPMPTATGTSGVSGIENVNGGTGDDILTGDGGPNRLVGNEGSDILTGGDGDDWYVFGPAGATREEDEINEAFDEGSDTLDFGENDEPITVNMTVDAIVRSTSRDVDSTSGTSWNFENVIGTSLDDTFTPNGSDNSLFGGDGHDRYMIDPSVTTGTATFYEEATSSTTDPTIGGEDTIDFTLYPASTGETFDMSQPDNTLTTGLVIGLRNAADQDGSANFENLIGGDGNDTLTGNDQDNEIDGGLGDDELRGLRGNDRLIGGDGVNNLYGGVGDDEYILVSPTGTTNLHEDVGTVGAGKLSPGGDDTIDLSALSGTVNFSLLNWSNTVGSLTVNLLNEDGTAGPEQFEIIVGALLGTNTLTGNSADNLLIGGLGNDTLEGGDGDDILLGHAGSDRIVDTGSTSDTELARDLLVGGYGADRLEGGEGDDILVDGGLTYVHPLDRTALNALRTAWLSEKSYEDRITELNEEGVGDGDAYSLSSDSYLDDTAVDRLMGETEVDWFLVDDILEVDDLDAATETATDLSP